MEADEPTRTTNAATPTRRFVYLAGPVEIVDTWRERAGGILTKMGFEPINPLRGEEVKTIGKHIQANVPASLIVTRDLNDLERTRASGGLVLMNLSTTAEDREPMATLCEMMWCWDHQVPIVGVVGRDCSPRIRTHPWVEVMVAYHGSSVTDALNLIENYFV